MEKVEIAVLILLIAVITGEVLIWVRLNGLESSLETIESLLNNTKLYRCLNPCQ